MENFDSGDTFRQSAFSRTCHSIRTRYSLVTAILLLTLLGVFYIGGRIVLVHLMRDAEAQVKDLGFDVRRQTMRDAGVVHGCAVATAATYAAKLAEGERLEIGEFLGGEAPVVTIILRFDGAGNFIEGRNLVLRGGSKPVLREDLYAYEKTLPQWMARAGEREKSISASVGLLRVLGRSDYVSVAKYDGGGESGYIVVGTPFDSQIFAAHINDALSGMSIRVTDRHRELPLPPPSSKPSAWPHGIAPMLSEALNFYSGGFWDVDAGIFEAVFTVRDIVGNPVSMLAISLPNSFASVTSLAIRRLTLFITIAGIVIILPIFWVQGRLLLNPLTEMTEKVRSIGCKHEMTDCPRLDWHGKDEFALLAMSVNSMLETISRRSIAVAHAEARQKAIITCVPDVLAVFDRNALLISYPKPPAEYAPIPGFAEGAAIDWRSYGVDDEDRFRKVLADVFATGAGNALRLRSYLPDGSPSGIFEVRVSKMDDHFALAMIRDVTAEVIEREVLAESEKRATIVKKQESMSLLAAGIAHDINNILSVILNTTEISLAEISAPAVKETLATVRGAVRRGSAMAKELMTYAGEARIVLTRSDPAALMAEAERIARSLVGPKVSVSCDFPQGLPAVDADPNQFWKVFLNLIKNAAESMRDRTGELRVTTRAFEMTADAAKCFHSVSPVKPGRGVLFTVGDTGPGIPPELISRIFDPYVSTKEGGRGLGLATVSSIVEAHSGGISVESAPGHGTVFKVFLPESRQPAAPKGKVASAGNAGIEADDDISGNTEVLVVDDDAGILKTTGIILGAIGYKAITASTSVDAIAEFRRHATTLRCVILDAHVEKVDTLRLLASFRATNPKIPVVISSGSSREQISEMFATQPFDGFLAKPYTLAELKAVFAK